MDSSKKILIYGICVVVIIFFVIFFQNFGLFSVNTIPNNARVIQTVGDVSLSILESKNDNENRAYIIDNGHILATLKLNYDEEPKIIGVTDKNVYITSTGQSIGSHGPFISISRKDGATHAEDNGEYWLTSNDDTTFVFSTYSSTGKTVVSVIRVDGEFFSYTLPSTNQSSSFEVNGIIFSSNEKKIAVLANNVSENTLDGTKYHGTLFVIDLNKNSIEQITSITKSPVVVDGYEGTRPFSQSLIGWIEDEQIRVLDNGQEKVISLTE